MKAIADIYNIRIGDAARIRRKNPLLGSEIHIEEELVNLEEAVQVYWAAEASFKKRYPKLHEHLAQERHAALKHCIGLIMRMIKGQSLPQPYSQQDCVFALKKLTRIVMFEMQKAGKSLDDKTMSKLRPLLGLRERWNCGDPMLRTPLSHAVTRVRYYATE